MARIALSCVLMALMLVITLPALAANAPVMEKGEGGSYRIHTPKSLPAPTRNIYEILGAHNDASKFLALVDKAELKSLLTGTPGEVMTAFIPTNEAMANLPNDVKKRIDSNPADLKSFVQYHVISGSIMTTSALKGRKSSPASASGEALQFDGIDRSKPPMVNGASLDGAEVSATNGTIHFISGPAVPPSMGGKKEAVKSAPPPALPPALAKGPVAPKQPTAPEKPSASPVVQTTTGEALKSATTGGLIEKIAPMLGLSTTGASPGGSAAGATTTAASPP